MNKHLEMIKTLVEKIEEDIAYEANIVDLANSMALSPWHFQRLFKTIVGDSLGGYIRGRRLSKAANMLLTEDTTIIQIAFDVGFSSNESFTRSFKSYFNLSPKEFRAKRPSVLLKKKPLLTDDLLEHITIGMHQEPIIVDCPEQAIIGFCIDVPSMFSTSEPICELLRDSWLNLFDRANEIENTIANTYYGLTVSKSGTFTESTLQYIAGVPVFEIKNVPDKMQHYILPKRKVAIFNTLANIEAEVAKRTVDYIYGYWLPNSPYERGAGNDYELFEDVYDFETGELSSKYVIPVVEKL